jgi:hypothetical protein
MLTTTCSPWHEITKNHDKFAPIDEELAGAPAADENECLDDLGPGCASGVAVRGVAGKQALFEAPHRAGSRMPFASDAS